MGQPIALGLDDGLILTQVTPYILQYVQCSFSGDDYIAVLIVRLKAFPEDHLDAHPAYYPKDTISGGVASCQAELMEMYFEHVHPAFAILGPQRPSAISSSLTLRASIYALALQHCPAARDIDPWIFTDFNKQALNIERQAPKLETIEAALLFAQRHAHVLRAPTMPGMSAEIGSIVGMAHDLGLNIDPVHWDISEHEKRRRRRLWWGVFMLDKWNALTLGRPSFLVDHQSNHSQPTLSDFAEDCSSTPPPKDRNAALQFIAMAGLTRILSKIMTYYFSVQSDLEDVDSLDTMPAFSKFEEELEHWNTQSLAPLLAEKAFPDPTGSLEIAYYTTQVTLYRGVLRELTSRSSPTDQFWEHLSQQSKTVALSVINLLEYLPVARSSTFWWATSKLNFSIVGSFMIRMYLSSTSTDARRFWMDKFNFYRKLLQAHSPGRGITTHALLRLDLLTNGQELKDSGTEDDYFVAPLIAADDIFSDTLSLGGFFVD
ncbi:related to DAL81-transcriptional activator for allantoin and GABA catabolic genes [Fusarium fujikuroi IMI 58289]|uniref:Related to DAL81-transcriptional activator for allantoin and GABA catabolic genes n=1 Tax=Gibberella fujikuroi (strain CBS 195.34 / IMI 58289 / NRRL A-6831) TaxID=1279085 RepID=S0E0L8_GIBF5|nr:DAL81-transcriptional activator-like protein [Fusarium fujikuroi IMI 58289]KLP19488.1 DAL81-transcriptional activator [Fusarium fujikuroi]CCT68195.1 related to DAL81-transcriptional activator for allantoin and GABA catabolic genes [Fusarium fujikuroi IMI 58289]SCN93368.1 related to DAL81-transcriptional activator for allantoin and GABA catabolic genes [Fusarium fujikuroi]SCO46526.1 related to DAL81-transcriptional activator for allantoin and GABA catabolic genes [Fusarium fujikuroi]SCV42426